MGCRRSLPENRGIWAECFFQRHSLVFRNPRPRPQIIEAAERYNSRQGFRARLMLAKIARIQSHQRSELPSGGMAGEKNATALIAIPFCVANQHRHRRSDVL